MLAVAVCVTGPTVAEAVTFPEVGAVPVGSQICATTVWLLNGAAMARWYTFVAAVLVTSVYGVEPLVSLLAIVPEPAVSAVFKSRQAITTPPWANCCAEIRLARRPVTIVDRESRKATPAMPSRTVVAMML